MNIIRRYQINPRLLTHPEQTLIDRFLGRNTVILKFQEKISLSKDFFQLQRFLLCIFIKTFLDILRNNARQTGAQSNNPLVIFPEQFHIHPRFIVKAFRKSPGYQLHQIMVACIILRKKHQMIVFIVLLTGLVKPGIRRNIDLASDDRTDACGLRRPVKINHAVHHAMIRNRHTVHAQRLRLGHQLFNFIGTIQ